jgi:hypothetical protein
MNTLLHAQKKKPQNNNKNKEHQCPYLTYDNIISKMCKHNYKKQIIDNIIKKAMVTRWTFSLLKMWIGYIYI